MDIHCIHRQTHKQQRQIIQNSTSWGKKKTKTLLTLCNMASVLREKFRFLTTPCGPSTAWASHVPAPRPPHPCQLCSDSHISSYEAGTRLPQGLCTCCLLYLECSSPLIPWLAPSCPPGFCLTTTFSLPSPSFNMLLLPYLLLLALFFSLNTTTA